MSDAAQGELPDHEVFKRPLKVEPVYEQWDTPRNYRDYAMGAALPDRVRVWRIQNVAKAGNFSSGVIAFHYAFTDSPDAEILTAGFNVGKESGAMGVGRQGNFLQWGFSASPAKMTEAGKAFFINCICYIRKFEGKGPIIRKQSLGREYSIYLASLIDRIKSKDFLGSIATPELLEQYKGNAAGLAGYYRQNVELMYKEGSCRVDTQLQELGIRSNRQLATLERLIALLRDEQKAAVARTLLGRYTLETFTEAEEWEKWYKANRDRIFFSDAGGYKFFVAPEGYLAATP